MASQIENNLASLSQLSRDCQAQLQAIFDASQSWLTAHSQTTIADFQQLVSDSHRRAAAPLSPVRTVRQKPTKRRARKQRRKPQNKTADASAKSAAQQQAPNHAAARPSAEKTRRVSELLARDAARGSDAASGVSPSSFVMTLRTKRSQKESRQKAANSPPNSPTTRGNLASGRTHQPLNENQSSTLSSRHNRASNPLHSTSDDVNRSNARRLQLPDTDKSTPGAPCNPHVLRRSSRISTPGHDDSRETEAGQSNHGGASHSPSSRRTASFESARSSPPTTETQGACAARTTSGRVDENEILDTQKLEAANLASKGTANVLSSDASERKGGEFTTAESAQPNAMGEAGEKTGEGHVIDLTNSATPKERVPRVKKTGKNVKAEKVHADVDLEKGDGELLQRVPERFKSRMEGTHQSTGDTSSESSEEAPVVRPRRNRTARTAAQRPTSPQPNNLAATKRTAKSTKANIAEEEPEPCDDRRRVRIKSTKDSTDGGSEKDHILGGASNASSIKELRSNASEAHEEFKAPKPRLRTTRHLERNKTNGKAVLGMSMTASVPSHIHQTPRTQTRALSSVSRLESATFNDRFVVDEEGRINEAGLGFLSEIASTPRNVLEDQVRKAPTGSDVAGAQSAKLYRPTADIYSSQRKPALSRMTSAQKTSNANRPSILAHTPGARAPSTSLLRPPTKTQPVGTALQQAMASLRSEKSKEESLVKDLKSGVMSQLDTSSSRELLPQVRPKANIEHSSQPETRTLTFAAGFQKMTGDVADIDHVGEPKTAPAKDSHRPRIARGKEKSALRCRIEGVRGKASMSTVTTDTPARVSAAINLSLESSAETFTTQKASGDVGVASFESSGPSACVEVEKNRSGKRVSPDNLPAPALDAELQSSAIESSASELDVHQPQAVLVGRQPKISEGEPASSHAFDTRHIATGSSTEPADAQSSAKAQGEVNGPLGEDTELPPTTQKQQSRNDAGRNMFSNLVSSVSSFLPGASSLLGVRTNDERGEPSEAEATAKRQRIDAERREAEVLARREAQRAVRQREAEEKQRRAEARRQLLAEAERAKEEERKRREEQRQKKKREEEDQRRRKKLEEDRKKEERRKQVLEKRALNMELEARRKAQEAKKQRQLKAVDRSATGIPKPGPHGFRVGKGTAVAKPGARQSPPLPPTSKHVAGGVSVGGDALTPRVVAKDMEGRAGPVSYEMTPARETVLELSDEEEDRRRHKKIPRWAQGESLTNCATSQQDPDRVFVNVPMCNLREVFGPVKKYRTRSSSANWSQDRVTAQEVMKFKKETGAFEGA